MVARVLNHLARPHLPASDSLGLQDILLPSFNDLPSPDSLHDARRSRYHGQDCNEKSDPECPPLLRITSIMP